MKLQFPNSVSDKMAAMGNIPRFSIAMPTYNRADLLPLAIRSVLAQTYKDFEIVISNGGSTDETRAAAKAFDDPRIRYIESPERLSIGDNYQTALDNARGEYVTFLSDDDAFAPNMLERVKRVIDEEKAEMVGFRFANYYHNDQSESYREHYSANSLKVMNFTGAVARFDKRQAVYQLFRAHGLVNVSEDKAFVIPYLANAVYKRDIFSRVQKVCSKPFAATPADMYLAAAVFFVIDDYYCLDEPLHVWSRWSGSATATPSEKGNAIREHYRKLLNGRSLTNTPLKFELPHNCAVDAILQASRDFNARDLSVDWALYYSTVCDNLFFMKEMGIDVSNEADEFQEVLASENQGIRSAVAKRTTGVVRRAKRAVRQWFPKLAEFSQSIGPYGKMDNAEILNGDEAGFSDALSAAMELAEIVKSAKQPPRF